jgi:hypothetical protein
MVKKFLHLSVHNKNQIFIRGLLILIFPIIERWLTFCVRFRFVFACSFMRFIFFYLLVSFGPVFVLEDRLSRCISYDGVDCRVVHTLEQLMKHNVWHHPLCTNLC